jgi:hypothetical protein
MASLTSLPTELKLAILAHLPFHSVVNLIRTCKGLHTVAQPALFRTLVLLRTGSTSQNNDFALSKPASIKRLLQVLQDRPDLAKQVESIAVHGSCSATSSNVDQEERGYLDALITLLLGECTRLKTLAVPAGFIVEDSHFWLASKGTREHADSMATPGIQETPPRQLNLPNLETLAITALEGGPKGASIDPETGDRIPASLPKELPFTKNLGTLRLLRAPAPTDAFKFQLQRTQRLHTLEYDCFSASTDRRLDLTLFRAALESVRSTLTHLVIKYDMYEDEAVDVKDLTTVYRGSMGSLDGFTALTTLETSIPLLFGNADFSMSHIPDIGEILPSSLRRLIITDDLWDYTAYFGTEGVPTMAVFKKFFTGERLMENYTPESKLDDIGWVKTEDASWKKTTPQLNEFVFDIRERGWVSYQYWVKPGPKQELERMCENQGIKCSILY